MRLISALYCHRLETVDAHMMSIECLFGSLLVGESVLFTHGRRDGDHELCHFQLTDMNSSTGRRRTSLPSSKSFWMAWPISLSGTLTSSLETVQSVKDVLLIRWRSITHHLRRS